MTKNCPNVDSILPLSPYHKLHNKFISIHLNDSNLYQPYLNDLPNSTTLLEAQSSDLRANFYIQDNPINITEFKHLKHKIPHIIFSDFAYNSCDSIIVVLIHPKMRYINISKSPATSIAIEETLLNDSPNTLNKSQEFINNLYNIISNQSTLNKDCILSQDTYKIDTLVKGLTNGATYLPYIQKDESSIHEDNTVTSQTILNSNSKEYNSISIESTTPTFFSTEDDFHMVSEQELANYKYVEDNNVVTEPCLDNSEKPSLFTKLWNDTKYKIAIESPICFAAGILIGYIWFKHCSQKA